jgi:hypothetical protein
MMTKTIPFACGIGAALLLQLGGCVSAPAGSTQSTLSKKTAISGMPMTAWFFYEMQRDCTSAGVPTILVTHHAAHGEVVAKEVDHFPEFPSTNPRSACNTQKSPSAVVVYTPADNYVGLDQFSIKAVFHGGQAIEKQFVVTVDAPPNGHAGAGQ